MDPGFMSSRDKPTDRFFWLGWLSSDMTLATPLSVNVPPEHKAVT